MRYFLSVDLGTISVKVTLFNVKGKIVSIQSGKSEYFIKGDRVEIDIRKYWKLCLSLIKRLIVENDVAKRSLKCLIFSGQSDTLVAVDRRGLPLIDGISWLDNRSKEEAKLIFENFGADYIHKKTGQFDCIPTWMATKIFWLRRNSYDLFKKVHKFLNVEDYFTYKLTGNYITDYTLPSDSLLMDVNKGKYWNEMLDFIGVDEKRLPAIVQPGKVLGKISEKIAEEIGLKSDVLVCQGGLDHAISMIGCGNIQEGMCSESTGGALGMCITWKDKPEVSSIRNLPIMKHVLDDMYYFFPWSPTAGLVIEWYANNFFPKIRKKHDFYEKLNEEMLKKTKPGSEGIVFLPFLLGAGSPGIKSSPKGLIYGLRLNHSKYLVLRSIYESIGFMIKRNLEFLEENNVKIREIVTIGGGAKSNVLNQIKADVTCKKILLPETTECVSLGNFILCAVSTNVFSNIREAIEKIVRYKKIFSPDVKTLEIYKKNFDLYKKLIELVKHLQ